MDKVSRATTVTREVETDIEKMHSLELWKPRTNSTACPQTITLNSIINDQFNVKIAWNSRVFPDSGVEIRW